MRLLIILVALFVGTAAEPQPFSHPSGREHRMFSHPSRHEQQLVSHPSDHGQQLVSQPSGHEQQLVSHPSGHDQQLVSHPSGHDQQLVSQPYGHEQQLVQPYGHEQQQVQPYGHDQQQVQPYGHEQQQVQPYGHEQQQVQPYGHDQQLVSQPSGHEQQLASHPSGHEKQPQEHQNSMYQRGTENKAYELAKAALEIRTEDWNDLFKPEYSLSPAEHTIEQDPNSIRFLLYFNPEDPEEYDEIQYGNLDSLVHSHYNPRLPLKILIHGFQECARSTFPSYVKNGYVAMKPVDDYNVIVVDWGELAMCREAIVSFSLYPRVVENVQAAGVRAGEFLSWLIQMNAAEANRIHIIGFSLGAHVAGRAGDTVKQHLSQAVARVTGIDPGGPGYFKGILTRKMSKYDGQFVDAIHTGAARFGIAEDCGQVDFWINGGYVQPGCEDKIDTRSALHVVKGAAGSLIGACDHFAAPKIWLKTILDGPEGGPYCVCDINKQDKSNCCDALLHFGEHCRPGTTGTFYMSITYPLIDEEVRGSY